jgi:hypothetical protein
MLFSACFGLLHEQYAYLLTVGGVADVLRYPSPAAVRQARAMGRLPVPLFSLPGRRTLFASAESVIKVLTRAQAGAMTKPQSRNMEERQCVRQKAKARELESRASADVIVWKL